MRAALIVLLTFALAGCSSPPVDLAKSLEVVDINSGWADFGVVGGQNKLVPSITFKLKNNSDQVLKVLQVNVTFRRTGDPSDWGADFRKIIGTEGLAPGATSEAVSLDSPRGYTGSDARADMLKHPQFVDATAHIAAKYGPAQLQAIGDFPISRQLLTR